MDEMKYDYGVESLEEFSKHIQEKHGFLVSPSEIAVVLVELEKVRDFYNSSWSDWFLHEYVASKGGFKKSD